jgi:hypothetical protein
MTMATNVNPLSAHPAPLETPPHGETPAGSGRSNIGRAADLRIRCAGLLTIGLSAGAGIWLHRLLLEGSPADPTCGQYALATITFVAASLGSGFLVLGRHVHDHIEVAERWRRHW